MRSSTRPILSRSEARTLVEIECERRGRTWGCPPPPAITGDMLDALRRADERHWSHRHRIPKSRRNRAPNPMGIDVSMSDL